MLALAPVPPMLTPAEGRDWPGTAPDAEDSETVDFLITPPTEWLAPPADLRGFSCLDTSL